LIEAILKEVYFYAKLKKLLGNLKLFRHQATKRKLSINFDKQKSFCREDGKAFFGERQGGVLFFLRKNDITTKSIRGTKLQTLFFM
jgi:hypothetical protein